MSQFHTDLPRVMNKVDIAESIAVWIKVKHYRAEYEMACQKQLVIVLRGVD
jgi:hypothetical protein